MAASETRWERAVAILENDSLDPAERFHAVWKLGEWPEEVFHRFACDCAERALQREQSEGREPDPQCWEALAVKRRWLEGSVTEEEWQETRATVRAAAHRASLLRQGGEAATAAADAVSEASYAVRAAAWALAAAEFLVGVEEGDAARRAEASWQIERLREILLGVEEGREVGG